MMSSLPEDIVINILTRLPLKSISKFRCVCKSWSNLFADPNFVKLQLNHSLKHHSTGILIDSNNTNISLVDCGSILSTVSNVVTNIDYPVEYRKHEIVGMCNGLMCYISNKKDIIIWNPFANDCMKLPNPPESTALDPLIRYGFGYDGKSEDYKFARIANCKSRYSELNVYSLSTNSWKTTVNIPFLYPFGRLIIFNGIFHWVETPYISSGLPRTIGSFDLESETFREIQLPKKLVDIYKFYMIELCHLEGCLYLIATGSMYKTGIEVWMMKEYGVKESWSKVFKIDPKKFGSANILSLRNSLGNGVIMVEANLLDQYLYDLKKKEARELEINGIPTPFFPWAFLGSLVSPTSLGTQCKKRKYDKQPQDRSNKPSFYDAEQHFSRKAYQ